MERAKIQEIKAYELHYSDLLVLSSSPESSTLSPERVERLQLIGRAVMENLGPTGPGLLAISGVPNACRLRRNLLPLARKLALLNDEPRKRLLKEHGLGSDVPLKDPDRTVSSFAMQLKYRHDRRSTCPEVSPPEIHSDQDYPDVEILKDEFKVLRNSFEDLGFCMMELGLCLARICDKAIGGQELEHSLLESNAAKGRLIHYHSTMDNLILKEAACKRKLSSKGHANGKHCTNGLSMTKKALSNEHTNLSEHQTMPNGKQSNLWQQWHYDYGVFTVLTAPLFSLSRHSQTLSNEDVPLIPCDQECPPPSGHSYLQIFYPNKNDVFMVKTSPESFIVQVGESADILSKGKLRSTLHCVCRPVKLENLSRETFVVFLQPAWNKSLTLSGYLVESLTSRGEDFDETLGAEQCLNKLTQEIDKIVPPLSLRLKDGMTFAEFSRETTKQYYGGQGLQSKR